MSVTGVVATLDALPTHLVALAFRDITMVCIKSNISNVLVVLDSQHKQDVLWTENLEQWNMDVPI